MPADERDEEQLAAEEAGAIGGPNPDPDVDEAERPRVEGGEGESEGFELAEEELVANATHDPDGHGNPLLDRIDEEREESDQLPEEQPESAVPEDDSGGKARDEAQENAGAAGEEESGDKSATGNPANAGQEQP